MGFPYLDILLLAVLATVIILRLRSVLGRRTGSDAPPRFSHRDNQGSTAKGEGNVIPLPGQQRVGAEASDRSVDEAFAKIAPEGSALSNSLKSIRENDRNFDPDSFLAGARVAYEMVVTAFAFGNRKELSGLLSREVYDSFEQAIAAREKAEKTVETDFVGIEKSEIVNANLKDRIAEVTVKFVSEIISVTKNADGAVIEGDPTRVAKITDVWTFARDTGESNPNWKVIGTAVNG